MRILIPTDFSELSKVAVKYAVDFSKDVDVSLILLHISDVNAPGMARVSSKKLGEAIKTSTEAAMKELVATIKKENSHQINISHKIVYGTSIAKTIETTALENNIDLICIGTKGATGLKKIVFGSNAAAIIEHSSIPVLTIPELAEYKGIGNIAYSSDLYHLDRELKLILPYAKLTDSWIRILHIDKDKEGFDGDLHEKEKSLRKDFAYEKIKFNELKSGSVIEGINKFVSVVDVDMVIMFTHHTNFLEKVFKKSVTQNTAFQTSIPLLTFQKEK
ncbi:universal stress protein [Sediminicola sp. 1XM1-17]|uniref:universal stress protein n=1 Tax=Sediminicola sp. 1XM1-17 TaxID=3127702 RepID=UPI003077356B